MKLNVLFCKSKCEYKDVIIAIRGQREFTTYSIFNRITRQEYIFTYFRIKYDKMH